MNILAKSILALTLLMGISVANAKVVTSLSSDSTYSATLTTSAGGTTTSLFELAANTADNTLFKFLISSTDSKKNKTGDFTLSFVDKKTDTLIKSINGSTDTTQPYSFIAQLVHNVTYKLIFESVSLKQVSSLSIAAVPEPETYALMGVGLLGLLAARRRKAMVS